jgi:hypothetical protein
MKDEGVEERMKDEGLGKKLFFPKPSSLILHPSSFL